MVKNYFSSLLIAIMLFAVGCQDNVNEEELKVEQVAQESEEFKLKLRKAALVFGEVLQDHEARLELAEYAKLEGNAGEIEVSLKKLFFPEKASNFRKSSAIVKEFYTVTSSNVSSRINSEKDKMNVDELLKFIEENNISIIAPYLAERFNISEIDGITVSYWTEDMEKDDPEYKGETPGYRISFDIDKASNILNWRSLEANVQNEEDWLSVNDEYAIKNPTIVIGSFKEPSLLESDPRNNGGGHPKYAGGSENLSSQNEFDCLEYLSQFSRHTLRMPKFRLTSNIRSWPNANYMYLWVITGEFETGSDGKPKPGSNTHHMLNYVKVSREDATVGRWIDGPSFIVHNLKEESDEIIMIWGVERPKTVRKYSGEVKMSEKGVPSGTLKAEWTLERDVDLIPYAPFDKCLIIEDNIYNRDLGSGRYGSFPIYQMSQIQFYFSHMLE